MDNAVDTLERMAKLGGVVEVRLDQADAFGDIGVKARGEVVKDDYLGSGLNQVVNDVAAYVAGSASYQPSFHVRNLRGWQVRQLLGPCPCRRRPSSWPLERRWPSLPWQ